MKFRSILIAGLVLLATALTAHAAIDLPSIGEPADNSLPPVEESKLGANVVRQLREHGMLLDDPEMSVYLQWLGHKLAASAETEPSHFDFFFINDNRINAFALPGGYVGVNNGLLLTTRNESELAGVLSHEIAHVTQRHVARQLEATKGLNMAAMAALLVALVASGGSGDIAQAAVAIGASAAQQVQINFTRAHEQEADRVGIRTLAAAGYDPNAMATFFQRLEEQTRLYGDAVPEILRSHPVNVNRISEAKSRAAAYPPAKPVDENEYRLMQARMHVLSSQQASEAIDYFHGRLKSPDAGEADRYGLALALLRAGQSDQALKAFRQLTDKDKSQLHYALGLARAQLATPQAKDALVTLERSNTLNPNYPPLTATYAEALLRFQRPADARRVLLATDSSAENAVPELHRLLAQAAQDLGWQAEALFRMSEYYSLIGDYSAAMDQLEAALRLPDLSTNDKARVTARLENLRKEYPKEARRNNRSGAFQFVPRYADPRAFRPL